MATKVTRKKVSKKATDIATTLRQFLTLKVQDAAISERMGALNKQIKDAIVSGGYEDDKGNFWFDLDEPVDVAGYGTVTQLKNERRVSLSLNEDKANEILAEKGILEDCQVTIVVLDEEEIRKAHFKGILTDEDIEAMFPAKESFALKPVKE